MSAEGRRQVVLSLYPAVYNAKTECPSAPCRVRACRKASGCGQRLSAFCFLVCFASAPRPIVMLWPFHCRGTRRRSDRLRCFGNGRIARMLKIASRERVRLAFPQPWNRGADS